MIKNEWNSIKTRTKGLKEETSNLIDHFLDEVADNGSKYLKIQDGQSVQLTFNLDSDETGYRERTFEKNGEKVEVKRFSFAVHNHYEVLNVMSKGIKNRRFLTKIKSILAEERKHLLLCTQLAKKNATASK